MLPAAVSPHKLAFLVAQPDKERIYWGVVCGVFLFVFPAVCNTARWLSSCLGCSKKDKTVVGCQNWSKGG